ncbi:hypothetical protein EAO77_10775 [Streptomyces sp. t39]|nr:hypothetical protein EAO77_10775 [Streptomyces sp. t39]
MRHAAARPCRGRSPRRRRRVAPRRRGEARRGPVTSRGLRGVRAPCGALPHPAEAAGGESSAPAFSGCAGGSPKRASAGRSQERRGSRPRACSRCRRCRGGGRAVPGPVRRPAWARDRRRPAQAREGPGRPAR